MLNFLDSEAADDEWQELVVETLLAVELVGIAFCHCVFLR